MTDAINGAGQSPAAALMSAVSAKVGEGERAQGKNASKETRAKGESLPDTAAPDRSAQSGDTPPVKDAKKPARGASDEGGKKDDKDASFEATIDSIDRTDDKGKQEAASSQAAGWNVAVAMAQAPVAQSKDSPAGKSADTSATSSDASGARPLQVLKQERLSVLLLARQRLLARDASEMTGEGAVADETVKVPVTVTSRETHWSFANTVPSEAVQEVAMADAEGNKSTVAAAPAANETTSAKGEGTAKASDSIKQPVPQMAPSNSAGDNADQQSSGDKQGAATASRDDRASANSKTRESAEPTVSKFTDRISTDDKSPANTISSAMQQVRNGLLGALTGDQLQASSTNPAPSLQSRLVTPGNVIRTIELTLSPADLGSVSLKLSLRANVLTVEAEASKASTAKLLSADRSILERNLRDAGYELSSLKIKDGGSSGAAALNVVTAAAAAPPSHAGGVPFQDGGQPRFGFAQYQGGDTQRRDSSSHDRSQQRSRGDTAQTSPVTDAGGVRQANAIYI
jgi:hypothetical protein